MYIINSIGPKTRPWGTPVSTDAGLDSVLLTFTTWLRSIRNAIIQFSIIPLIPLSQQSTMWYSIKCFSEI